MRQDRDEKPGPGDEDYVPEFGIRTPSEATYVHGVGVGCGGSPETCSEPNMLARSGQRCTVVRPLTFEEADLYDTGPMYLLRFEDGEEASAYEDELSEVSA